MRRLSFGGRGVFSVAASASSNIICAFFTFAERFSLNASVPVL